jgi:hypothetical protein
LFTQHVLANRDGDDGKHVQKMKSSADNAPVATKTTTAQLCQPVDNVVHLHTNTSVFSVGGLQKRGTAVTSDGRMPPPQGRTKWYKTRRHFFAWYLPPLSTTHHMAGGHEPPPLQLMAFRSAGG